MSADSSTTPPSGSSENDSARGRRGSGRRLVAPIGGVVLILIGLAVLAENFGYKIPDNWWAVLFLVPAAALLYAAQRRATSSGRGLDRDVVGLLFGGVVFTALFLITFFNLNSELFGSVILIAVGIGLLMRHYWPRQGGPG